MTYFRDVVMFRGGVEVLTCLFVFFGFLGVVSLGCVIFFSTICSGPAGGVDFCLPYLTKI